MYNMIYVHLYIYIYIYMHIFIAEEMNEMRLNTGAADFFQKLYTVGNG